MCCRCIRLPGDCQCPATTNPAEGCLTLDLEHVQELPDDDPDCEVTGQPVVS